MNAESLKKLNRSQGSQKAAKSGARSEKIFETKSHIWKIERKAHFDRMQPPMRYDVRKKAFLPTGKGAYDYRGSVVVDDSTRKSVSVALDVKTATGRRYSVPGTNSARRTFANELRMLREHARFGLSFFLICERKTKMKTWGDRLEVWYAARITPESSGLPERDSWYEIDLDVFPEFCRRMNDAR